MKQNNFLTDAEFQDLTGIDIQTLVASRLEDLADQVEQLHVQGYPDLAALLREEGLQLAQAYDDEATFLYLEDLTPRA